MYFFFFLSLHTIQSVFDKSLKNHRILSFSLVFSLFLSHLAYYRLPVLLPAFSGVSCITFLLRPLFQIYFSLQEYLRVGKTRALSISLSFWVIRSSSNSRCSSLKKIHLFLILVITEILIGCINVCPFKNKSFINQNGGVNHKTNHEGKCKNTLLIRRFFGWSVSWFPPPFWLIKEKN